MLDDPVKVHILFYSSIELLIFHLIHTYSNLTSYHTKEKMYKFGIYVVWSNWYLDVDECTIANGECEQRCINTEGSFYCDCHEGHALENDNRQCGGKKDPYTMHACTVTWYDWYIKISISLYTIPSITRYSWMYSWSSQLHWKCNMCRSSRLLQVCVSSKLPHWRKHLCKL